MALSVSDYIGMYWSNLESSLDSLNDDIFDELVTDSANVLAKYKTDHLTTIQLTQVKALIVCSQAGSMSAIPGWQESKFLTSFKTGSLTKVKPSEVYDYFTEEVKQFIPNYNEIATVDKTVSLAENVYRKNTSYYAPKLDQRDRRILTTALSELKDEEFEGDR